MTIDINVDWKTQKRLTNREYMIGLLASGDEESGISFIDDGGASYEAMVHYNIRCPYNCGDERAHCHDKDDDFINRDNCFYCKHEWLDQEVDE